MIGTNTQPLNQWREVCRWDEPETPAFKVVDKPLEVDWQATAGYWEQRYEETRRDLEALAARFNSRPLEERITVTEDQVSVRPYVRAKPRRSKLVETEATPTEDIGEGVSESQTKAGDQGEASGRCGTCRHGEDSLTCLVCEDWSDYDTIPQSGEERSE